MVRNKKRLFILIIILLLLVFNFNSSFAKFKLKVFRINNVARTFGNYVMKNNLYIVNIFLASGMNPDTVAVCGGILGKIIVPAIVYSSAHNQYLMTRLLIYYGANVNIWNGSALINAAQQGNSRIVKLLLNNGAKVNNKKGKTALDFAIYPGKKHSAVFLEHNYKKCIKLLREYGAKTSKELETEKKNTSNAG